MRHAIITVGLLYGDEGKGACIDFLTRELKPDLIVRYCGGHNAGHNVQLADGRRHTFSQFGSGLLADPDVHTYIGPRCIVEPLAMQAEATHLVAMDVDPYKHHWVDGQSLLATQYHLAMNRIRELSRKERHGTCGVGLGETRHYWLKHGADAPVAYDIREGRSVLADKLALLQARLRMDLQAIPVSTWDGCERYVDMLQESPRVVADRMCRAWRFHITQGMPYCNLALFEGAQGVLLDEWAGTQPHTTWSTVTLAHALDLIPGGVPTQVLGLLRAYATRHGEGPLQCQVTGAPQLPQQIDPGNPDNAWQGHLRVAPLCHHDLTRAVHALERKLDGLVVSHLDQLPLLGYCDTELRSIEPFDLLAQLSAFAPIAITAHGPTAADRKFINKSLVTGVVDV